MVQTFCASVLQVPLSLGAIQKVLNRVTQALAPHYDAMARQTRHAAVNDIEATSWFCHRTLQGLGGMTNERAAFSMIHPHRSNEAFAALIEEWGGLLVRDGSGGYQTWGAHRQTCLAHLIRTARG
jgi:transposase